MTQGGKIIRMSFVGVFLLLGISWMWSASEAATTNTTRVSIGYILEYRQNCLCEWPPFSGQCYGHGMCQKNINTGGIDNVVCVKEGNFGAWKSSCGNGVVDCNESCDPSLTGAGRSFCDQAYGIHDWHAESGKTQACTSTCSWDGQVNWSVSDCGGYCGDGIVQSQYGETCEGDGFGTSTNDQYRCQQCKFVGGYCGDGIVQSQYGEQCDMQAGLLSGESCTSTCKKECRSGYHVEASVCVADERSCQDESGHGTGMSVWSITTQRWGACEAKVCDRFYRTSEGNCIANLCDVFDHDGRTKTGTGLAEWNASTNEVGSCSFQVTCTDPSLYRVVTVNGKTICERNSCEGNAVQSCTPSGGNGSQERTCNANAHPPVWSAWSDCKISACNQGYRLYNGECEPSTCTDPLTQSCADSANHIVAAVRARPCIDGHPPVPGAWGVCQISACASGYRVYASSGGQICELDHCEGDALVDCTAQKPHSLGADYTKTCSLGSHPPVWENKQYTCTIRGCVEGYRENTTLNVCEPIIYQVVGQAWSTNAGWMDLHPNQNGLTYRRDVEDIHYGMMGGYAWNANTGYISFNGVTVNLNKELEGRASYTIVDMEGNTVTKYIELQPQCAGDPLCGVRFVTSGTIWKLSGYAWDEYFGWINFDTGVNAGSATP